MRVFSFSGGRTSAYMLKLLYEKGDIVTFANTGKEAEGTLKFVKDCSIHWGIPIVWLEYTMCVDEKFLIVNYDNASRDGQPFKELCIKKRFLPNVSMRFCSMELKALTIKRYLKSIGIEPKEVDMYLGIRYDEPRRYYRLKGNNRNGWENVMPLFKLKKTKEDVMNFWENHNFDLQINKYEGNCDLCFLKGTTKKIQLLRDKPEVAKFWIDMEIEIGATFHKKHSIKDLLKMSETQLNLFDSDDIDCACNID